MEASNAKGHLLAFFCVLIWGTTFISTKIILDYLTPIEILFIRFSFGFIALCLFYPKRLKLTDKKQEFLFMAAGLCGVTLYFLLENIALTYTFASNIGIIVAVAPFFTALFSHFLIKEDKLAPSFFIGFVFAIAGISIISLNGSAVLKLNPMGDILAFFAALVWALYSVLSKKITALQYNTIQTTRRTFFYGLIFMAPALFFMDFSPSIEALVTPKVFLNLIYLSFGASALCFVMWNVAIKAIGSVKTSAYIYMSPVVTVITSAIVLKEIITPVAMVGTCLTLLGLVISEYKKPAKLQDI